MTERRVVRAGWRPKAASNQLGKEAGTPDIELRLPARAENVAVVRHALSGVGEALEIGEQTLADIRLAVTEACTNVVVHAYDEAGGPMEVSATVTDRTLT